MRAIFFQDGRIEFVDRPRPAPDPGQALIQVSAAGICATDEALFSGYYSFTGVPGHEFVGRVVEAPDRPDLVGRRVVASINIGCGDCPWCRAGDARHCATRRAIGVKDWDGAFAEYVLAPTANLHPVPDTMTDEEAAFVEPLAAALSVVEQVHVAPQMKAAVLGDGRLGVLIAVGLSRYMPKILLIGRHAHRLQLAADQGVSTLLTAAGRNEEPARVAGFDLVVEATGRPDGLNAALGLVRPRGTVVAKTTTYEPSPMDLARLVVDEVRLVGSRCGDFDLALTFLRHGLIQVAPLIDSVYHFNEFMEAFARARTRGAGKVLITF